MGGGLTVMSLKEETVGSQRSRDVAPKRGEEARGENLQNEAHVAKARGWVAVRRRPAAPRCAPGRRVRTATCDVRRNRASLPVPHENPRRGPTHSKDSAANGCKTWKGVDRRQREKSSCVAKGTNRVRRTPLTNLPLRIRFQFQLDLTTNG